MNKIYLILISLLIFSCKEENSIDKIFRYTSEISYFKDNKTDLCFAYVWAGTYDGGPAMANVPCENVKQFLKEKPNF